MWVCGCDADEWLFESTVKAQLRFHQDKGNGKLCTLTRVWAHPNTPAQITERPLLWTRDTPRRYATLNWFGECCFNMCARMHACVYKRTLCPHYFACHLLYVFCQRLGVYFMKHISHYGTSRSSMWPVVHAVITKLTAIPSFSRPAKFIYFHQTLERTRQIYYKQIYDSRFRFGLNGNVSERSGVWHSLHLLVKMNNKQLS